MLEKFRKAKKAEIAELAANGAPEIYKGERPSFRSSLQGPDLAVIAEYKRASPSRGLICGSVAVEDAARQYARAGASALSILTEKDWFKGDLGFIARAAPAGLPILRKDFIFDPLQVAASAATQASAILLIVRLTPDIGQLRDLREMAESFGLDAVVEVFAQDEVEIARASGARIIQVNARDLQKLEVNRDACNGIIRNAAKEANETWIAASGIETPDHLAKARAAGFDAALVGTALMRDGHPGEALAKLLANAG